MLRRLGFKASLPALVPGGRRSFSVVASNFPFANEAEGFKNRCHAGVDNSIFSSSEKMFNNGHLGNVRPTMALSKQALAFPRHAGVDENMKPSLSNSFGDDDEFAELGPSLSNCVGSGSDMAEEKLKDTKPLALFLDNASHQSRRTHLQHSTGRKSYGIPQKEDSCQSNFSTVNQNDVSRNKNKAEKQKYATDNNQSQTSISIDKDTKPLALFLDNASHQSRRTHLQHSAGRKSYGIPQKEDSCQSNFSTVNQNDVSRNKNEVSRNKNKAEKQKYETDNNQAQTSISIDKVPSDISLQNLREEVLVYGEIVSASLRPGPDRLTSCHIKFKSIESKERVLATQWITVRNCRLQVRDLYIPEYITIRVGNISMETAETAIHSMCISCGDVAGLARTKEGAVDVIFRVKGNLAAETILKRLNNVYYDDCQWSAHLIPKIGHNSSNKASASQWSVGSQINNLMGTFRKQFQMQRIYLEDLEDLHYAVLHLRERPIDMNSQKAHDG